MSSVNFLPKDWIDLKIGSKIIFVNKKDKLLSFYPPMELKNLNTFLNFYQIEVPKEEISNLFNVVEENVKVQNVSKSVQNIKSIKVIKEAKENYDRFPITDNEKLTLIKNYWEKNQNDLQVVLKKSVMEKYNICPDFQYSTSQTEQKEIFTCMIKIRHNFLLCKGESEISKSKAKEDAIHSGLKTLIPEIYNSFKNKEFKIDNNSIAVSNTNDDNFKNVIKEKNMNIIDHINIIELTDTESSDCNEVNSSNLNFLGNKRKRCETDDIYSNSSKKKQTSVETEECIFGGCLKEEMYGNLDIDDPIVVDKYLNCANYTPLSILNTFKVNNSKIDVIEKTFTRNDAINFEKLKNQNYTKVIIQSQAIKIKVECSSNNKRLAREYCAQKFLKKVYQNNFTKWVDLVKYYENKIYLKEPIKLSVNCN